MNQHAKSINDKNMFPVYSPVKTSNLAWPYQSLSKPSLSFPIMLEEEEQVPQWVAHLEKPKKFKLAHELGAGAPCTTCSYCPGLELHFWRYVRFR